MDLAGRCRARKQQGDVEGESGAWKHACHQHVGDSAVAAAAVAVVVYLIYKNNGGSEV